MKYLILSLTLVVWLGTKAQSVKISIDTVPHKWTSVGEWSGVMFSSGWNVLVGFKSDSAHRTSFNSHMPISDEMALMRKNSDWAIDSGEMKIYGDTLAVIRGLARMFADEMRRRDSVYKIEQDMHYKWLNLSRWLIRDCNLSPADVQACLHRHSFGGVNLNNPSNKKRKA